MTSGCLSTERTGSASLWVSVGGGEVWRSGPCCPSSGPPKAQPSTAQGAFSPLNPRIPRGLKLHLLTDSLESPEEASGEGVVAGMLFTEAGTVLYSSGNTCHSFITLAACDIPAGLAEENSHFVQRQQGDLPKATPEVICRGGLEPRPTSLHIPDLYILQIWEPPYPVHL